MNIFRIAALSSSVRERLGTLVGITKKLSLTQQQCKTIGCVLILIAVAPFAIEFVLLADFVGVEFAVTFMLFYFKTLYEDLVQRWWRFRLNLANGFDQVIDSCFFQPRAYGVSAVACSVVILMTGTTLVACVIWLPAILTSGGYG